MTNVCPKCDQPLATVARGASRCSNCAGTFVAAGAVAAPAEEQVPQDGGHDARGGRCPIDRTIMTRTDVHLGGERGTIHLERCSSCRGIWFDGGEWSALAERQLLDRLDELWTVEWRGAQRRQRDEEAYERRLAETFGPELLGELRAVADRLRGHERRSQALAFIREASEER